MPLTEKGKRILSNMISEYGEAKGKEVFYASKNAGRIKGVDEDEEYSPTEDKMTKDSCDCKKRKPPIIITIRRKR